LKISFIILFLLNVAALQYDIVSAQKKHSVSNAETREPIPYATIKILHTERGAYSDERGEFQLAFSLHDSILITSIGFKPTVFVIRDEHLSVFKLLPAAEELGKVTVKNRKLYKKHTLGNGGLKQDGYWCFFSKGEQIAQLVSFPVNDDNVFKIKTVTIPIELTKESIPILLHVYNVNQSGLPGKELLSNTYLIRRRMVRANKAVINLEREALWINDKGVFISIQGQPPPTYNTSYSGDIKLPLSYKIGDTLTFLKAHFTVENRWSPVLQGKADRTNFKLINTLFTVEVEEYR
jgi:hypothetical protein